MMIVENSYESIVISLLPFLYLMVILVIGYIFLGCIEEL